MWKYRKKQNKDGTWDAYVNGDWTLTGTEAEVDKEIEERKAYEIVWQSRNGNRSRPGDTV
jgi:hypothetical protein